MPNDRLKQKKQKQRQDRLAEQKQRAESLERERKRRAEYPTFVWDDKNGDPEFVKLVRDAVSEIDFDDRTIFPAWERSFYRSGRRVGWKAAEFELRGDPRPWNECAQAYGKSADVHIATHVGTEVLRRIPEVKLREFMPANDVCFLFRGTEIVAQFRTLLSTKSGAFYSRRCPTISVDGVPKIVAFSKHAMDQVAERIEPKWVSLDYSVLGDLYALFENCVHFERCDLYPDEHGNTLAFTFYDVCVDDRFWAYNFYVKHVLGEDKLIPEFKQYLRVGYCPAVIEGDFIKAKTLLFPGFGTTPERGAILRSNLPRGEKDRLIELAKTQNAQQLKNTSDSSVIKWFHENGVPQVIQTNERFFEYGN